MRAIATSLAAGFLALGIAADAGAAGNLNAVLESEVVFLDPHQTTANITRTFGFMVYDTLFAMDGKGAIQPQMVGATAISDDRLTYSFTLRDGLAFHDGAPVTAADVVASLRRWMPRDAIGRMLQAATATLEAPDAKTVVLRLKEPFPLVIQALGKPNAIVPFIVPERLAGGAADAKITEITGSGPFIFRKEEWRAGDRMVLDRNHANPPFDDPAIRRVLWKLVDQKSMLEAIGIPPEFRVDQCASFWMCGTPLESKAGAAAFRFNIEEAKAALKQTAYTGEKIVVMELPNSPTSLNPAFVLVDAMRKAGFTVDEQSMDWGTLLQRRAKKDTWNLFAVYSNGVDMSNPLTHFYVAANCSEFAGWSCDPDIKPLVAAFVKADGEAERRRIADRIQELVYANTPSVMWGQFTVPTGYRNALSGVIESSFPMFWQVEKR